VSRLSEAIAGAGAARGRRRGALVPYLTAGFPSMRATEELAMEMDLRGAAALELGVPFSDPLADGPVIQRASSRALAGGASLKGILKMIERLRARGARIPVVIFSYYNPIYRFGIEEFARRASGCGADGLLVPDLPPEEGRELSEAIRARGLDMPFLAAPTTTDGRLARIGRASSGFVYLVSLTGVTGARKRLPPDLAGFVARARRRIDLPLAVGFGISTPDQVRAVLRIADAAVVGSAIVGEIERNAKKPDMIRRVGSFVGRLLG